MVKPYKLGSLNCKAQIYSSLERTKNNVHSFTTGIKSFLKEHSSCFPLIDLKIFIKQALVSRKSRFSGLTAATDANKPANSPTFARSQFFIVLERVYENKLTKNIRPTDILQIYISI